jgi:hypothetical protein
MPRIAKVLIPKRFSKVAEILCRKGTLDAQ